MTLASSRPSQDKLHGECDKNHDAKHERCQNQLASAHRAGPPPLNSSHHREVFCLRYQWVRGVDERTSPCHTETDRNALRTLAVVILTAPK